MLTPQEPEQFVSATFLASIGIGNSITHQAIELESCSNPQKMQVF